MKNSVLVALAGLVSLALLSMPANAQATRTWVSGVGSDTNPCSRTAPCQTLSGAFGKTIVGGEIDCLDPGGFGSLTITNSITILCSPTGNGGVLVSGTPGITVSAPAGSRVVIDGLDFEGLAQSAGTAGTTAVNILGQGLTIIRNSSIRNFSGNGVNVAGTVGVTRALIINTLITGNGVGGATAGGVNVTGTGGATNNLEIINSVIDSNTNFNVQMSGPSTGVLTGSTLTGTTPTDISLSGGANLISYGNNVLRNSGAPSQTLTLQ